jgi:regulator of cell morphogenesis and NO signaling
MKQMDHNQLQTTVGQWVARHPQLSRLFESLKIDYCCGGGVTLADACQGRRVDPEQVLAQIHEAIGARSADERDWTQASLAALCDHIEQTHHAYLKNELPRLTAIVAKVAAVHGEHHPELRQVERTFAELRAELEPHMFKEERILFPAIRHLEQAAAPPAFPFGTVANPIRMMEFEHDHSGDALERIRALTGDYQPPEGACNTYRAMLDGLRQLEQDMHLHVHKENNILFPRAVEVEGSLVRV